MHLKTIEAEQKNVTVTLKIEGAQLWIILNSKLFST